MSSILKIYLCLSCLQLTESCLAISLDRVSTLTFFVFNSLRFIETFFVTHHSKSYCYKYSELVSHFRKQNSEKAFARSKHGARFVTNY